MLLTAHLGAEAARPSGALRLLMERQPQPRHGGPKLSACALAVIRASQLLLRMRVCCRKLETCSVRLMRHTAPPGAVRL